MFSDATLMFWEKVEEVAELDVGRLEAGEREMALEFWKRARSYALEEASYLQTRADRIEQKGVRHPSESYAQIKAIVNPIENQILFSQREKWSICFI